MNTPLELFGLTSEAMVWEVLLLIFVSLAVGILGGFVGLAMGTIRLAVMLFLGLPAPLAAGTNILVSTLSTFSGSARHLRQGNVDLRVMAMMGFPALVGALLGGLFGGQAPESLLVALVGVFVAWQGVEFIVRGRREPPQLRQPIERGREPFTSGRVVAGMGSGLSIGLLGGAVGLILGSISLPAMVRLLRMDPRVAAGTNLALGFLVGSFGFIGHGVRGEVDVPLLVAMGVAAMLGSYYGARFTEQVRLKTLALVMGMSLMVGGALLLGEALISRS